MKKLFSIFLAMVMMFSLTGCFDFGFGGGGKSNDPNVGKYIGYQIYILDWEPIGDVYDEGDNYIELQSGGKGVFCLDGEPTKVKWNLEGEKLIMSADGMDCNATLKDGVITTDFFGYDIQMTFMKEGMSAGTTSGTDKEPTTTGKEPTPTPIGKEPAPGMKNPQTASAGDSKDVSWWNGDWYGWWSTFNVTGDYVGTGMDGNAWDCQAHIALDKKGKGTLEVWDADLPKGDGVAEVPIQLDFSTGSAVSTGGGFMDENLAANAWNIQPDIKANGNLILIEGHFIGESGEYDYRFYLRPWGEVWTEDESFLPDNYSSWYLPLINAGASMPDSFDA